MSYRLQLSLPQFYYFLSQYIVYISIGYFLPKSLNSSSPNVELLVTKNCGLLATIPNSSPLASDYSELCYTGPTSTKDTQQASHHCLQPNLVYCSMILIVYSEPLTMFCAYSYFICVGYSDFIKCFSYTCNRNYPSFEENSKASATTQKYFSTSGFQTKES